VELRPAAPDASALAAEGRVAFVSGYLAIIEAGALGTPIVAHHGDPLKEDYLRCHPMADALWIASTPEEIAQAYEQALAAPPDRLRRMQEWAQAQTWERVAGLYAAAYRSASRSRSR